MEKNLNPFSEQLRDFNKNNINEVSSLSLAYIGDGVFELLVRSHLIDKNTHAKKLHLKSINYVKAASQKKFFEKITHLLNEDEIRVFKRARNTKINTMAKNATLIDYKIATGLEALFGYWYLLGDMDRINFIFREMVKDES